MQKAHKKLLAIILAAALLLGIAASSIYAFMIDGKPVGRINIAKTNANKYLGDYFLGGAVFEILDLNGNFVELVATDGGGYAQSKWLEYGLYFVRERTAPAGYVVNQILYPVVLASATPGVPETPSSPVAYANITVPNDPQPGIIRVKKINTNPEKGNLSLANAVFDVYAKNDIEMFSGGYIYRAGDLVDTIYTDASGDGQSKDLPLGFYVVVERNAPSGYSNPIIH